jgi:hypothetical protein
METNFAQLSKNLVAAVDRMEKGGIAAHAKDPMGMAALFLTNQPIAVEQRPDLQICQLQFDLWGKKRAFRGFCFAGKASSCCPRKKASFQIQSNHGWECTTQVQL